MDDTAQEITYQLNNKTRVQHRKQDSDDYVQRFVTVQHNFIIIIIFSIQEPHFTFHIIQSHPQIMQTFLPKPQINKKLIIIMQKANTWAENSILRHSKKAHSQSIISISPYDPQSFFTSSEDNTLRMWDIRIHSSVKIFRNEALINLTNCENDKKSLLFVGAGQHVYSFDIRKQSVFIQDLLAKTQQPHFDDISFIRLNTQDGVLGVGDDEGDIRLYNLNLECTELLDQGHNNIVNAVEFVTAQQGKLCITGGFDGKLIHWKISDQQIVREVDVQDLFNKQEIKASTMPFIYSILLHKTTLFVTTESGHVLSFPLKELKKPKYILEASLSRVVQAKIAEFNENILVTLARDGTFSLFDHTKRHNGVPLFLQKYKCTEQPNWIEIIRNEIIISSSQNAELYFFKVK